MKARGRSTLFGVVSVWATVAMALTAQAQTSTPSIPDGLWGGVSIGPGWATMDCGRCALLPDSIPYAGGSGFTVSGSLGGALSPAWFLGAATTVYVRGRGKRDASLVNIGPVVRVYPLSGPRAFVSATVGYSFGTLAGGGTLIESSGTFVEAGVGMEWFARGPMITAHAGYTAAFYSKSAASESGSSLGVDPPHRPRMFRVAVGMTWY